MNFLDIDHGPIIILKILTKQSKCWVPTYVIFLRKKENKNIKYRFLYLIYIVDNGCNDGGILMCLNKGSCLRNGSCSCGLKYKGINCAFKRTGFIFIDFYKTTLYL